MYRFSFLAFLLVCTLTVNAQDKTAKIRELLKVMHADEMMISTMENLKQFYINNLPADAAIDAAKKDTLISFVMRESTAMGLKVVNEDMVELYARYFTLEEIQAYIDFYKTPAGQKLLEQQPLLQKELMQIMQVKYLPEMMETIKKKAEELAKP